MIHAFSHESHPIQLISDLRDRYGKLTLSFSEYVYRPQSPFDERSVFDVPIDEITIDWLEARKAQLRPQWELALNSRVVDARKRVRHLPMIDFHKPEIVPADLLLMRSLLGAAICGSLTFFDSGRSLHAYGVRLLDPGEWREFMGRLLLLNMPNTTALVDARWVGHRLIAGYCALRWTANSDQYLKVPARAVLGLNESGAPPAVPVSEFSGARQ